MIGGLSSVTQWPPMHTFLGQKVASGAHPGWGQWTSSLHWGLSSITQWPSMQTLLGQKIASGVHPGWGQWWFSLQLGQSSNLQSGPIRDTYDPSGQNWMSSGQLTSSSSPNFSHFPLLQPSPSWKQSLSLLHGAKAPSETSTHCPSRQSKLLQGRKKWKVMVSQRNVTS